MILLVAQALAFSHLDTCDGTPTRWPESWTTWRMSTDGNAPLLPGRPDAWVVDQNQAAWDTWAAVDGCCAAASLTYGGPTSAPFAVLDAHHTVSIVGSGWDPALGEPSTTASATVVAYGAMSCTIMGADQLYNAAGFALADPTQVDLRSLMTHENGHWLGIDHSAATHATMAAVVPEGADARVLSADDDAAVCALQVACDGLETCDNGVDDLGNGRVDCQDPTCAGHPACLCPAVASLVDGQPQSTRGAPALVDTYSCVDGLVGPEQAFQWIPPADGQLRVLLSEPTVPLTLIGGLSTEAVCIAGKCAATSTNGTSDTWLDLDVEEGVPVQLVVDSTSPLGGDFVLRTSFTPGGAATCTEPAPPLACGARIEDTNLDGPRNRTRYACSDWDTIGPEAAYTFTSEQDATVTVTLSQLAADLDLFVTEATPNACAEEVCIASSGRDALVDETLTFEAVAGVPYRVVADAYGPATTPFVLDVSCESAPEPVPTGCASAGTALPTPLISRRR